MVAAAVCEVAEVLPPPGSVPGLDVATVRAAYRDALLRPNLLYPLELDGEAPASAMPLVVLALRKHGCRTVRRMLALPCVREMFAIALDLSEEYVKGYWDGWFAPPRPTCLLTPTYCLGFEDGAQFRDYYLLRLSEGRCDVD